MNRICRKNQKLLSAYIDGMLPERVKKSIDEHLNSCPECQKALRELEFLRELLREFPEKHPGLGFETAILSRVKEKPEVTVLRSWSRRASYGLAGLALLLIMTLYLQKPVIPPQLDITRTPSPGGLAVERKKTEPVSEQKSPAPTKQKVVSGSDVLADKDAEKPSAPAPFLAEGKLKSEMLPVPQVVDSLARAEHTTILEKEAGKSAVALRKTAGVSADKESRFLVIRNKMDWENAWNSQNTRQNLSLPLPAVDFKKQMVVALPTNQAGREYKIVKTEEKPDRIVVQYRATRPVVDPLLSSGVWPGDGSVSTLSRQDEVEIIPPYQVEVVNIRPSVEFQKLD